MEKDIKLHINSQHYGYFESKDDAVDFLQKMYNAHHVPWVFVEKFFQITDGEGNVLGEGKILNVINL